VQALENDIRSWIKAWNDNPKPFIWTTAGDTSHLVAGHRLSRSVLSCREADATQPSRPLGPAETSTKPERHMQLGCSGLEWVQDADACQHAAVPVPMKTPVIGDGVVRLRPWLPGDARFLLEASADPAIQRYSLSRGLSPLLRHKSNFETAILTSL
jgi:hypothetical protein